MFQWHEYFSHSYVRIVRWETILRSYKVKGFVLGLDHGSGWIKRIVGVKRANKRRMNGLRVEVGVKESFKNLVRTRLKRAGHVVRF